MKKSKKLLNKIKITGYGSVGFINKCIANNINLNNIVKSNSKGIEFEVNDKDYKRLKKVDNLGVQIKLISVGGKKRLAEIFLNRIGLIIGLIISLSSMFFLKNKLLQVHILGLTMTQQEKVIETLEELGVTKLSTMNYDISKIESELSKKYNFSLVSIITKGNSIIINVKEELPDFEDSYAPITADYNMVIKNINVYSGTQKVKVGDVVYKGNIIVEPFIQRGDSKVYVDPCADILAEVYFSENYIFKNSEEILVRTGKKQIVLLNVNLGKFNIKKQTNNTTFKEYEFETSVSQISSYFLPIIIEKNYAYELTYKTLNRDFESEKDSVISALKVKLYSKIDEDISIENEDVIITPISDGYIINIHMSSTLELKYS